MTKGTKAVAYLRTSSAVNVGADKDSDARQRDAIAGFAKRAGFVIADEFYDAAVSGADHIDQRPGFTAMLKRIEGNGVRTILVETAHRFARDLMVQEVGYAMLKERGIELIAAGRRTANRRGRPDPRPRRDRRPSEQAAIHTTSASICEADQLFLANVESISVALAAAVKGRRHGNRASLRLWPLDAPPPLRACSGTS